MRWYYFLDLYSMVPVVGAEPMASTFRKAVEWPDNL